eukprot:5120694-Prymnesium_polylepis.3
MACGAQHPPTLHCFDVETLVEVATEKQTQIRDIFDEYDSDRSGTLSPTEVRPTSCTTGTSHTRAHTHPSCRVPACLQLHICVHLPVPNDQSPFAFR